MLKNVSIRLKILFSVGLIVFIVFAAVNYNMYKHSYINAAIDLKDQAEKVRSLIMAFRKYQLQVILKYKIEMDEVYLNFLPAFALGKISQEYPNWDNSGFSFKNVSDIPRNPEHAADKIELKAMEYFRKHPTEQILYKRFNNPKQGNKPYYLYARPIWVEHYCLKCHGKKEYAPKIIQEKYNNAYGYRVGDLRGILSIKLPAQVIEDRAYETFIKELIVHVVAFFTIIITLIIIIKHFILDPVEKIAKGIDAVSSGDYGYKIEGLFSEFNKIGLGFNNMVSTIKDQQDALRSINDSLELKIKERTEELETANLTINSLNDRLKLENSRMSAELTIAKTIQEMVLPKKQELDSITELDISGHMNPAEEVGGDYYDVIRYKDIIKIGIGDVTGHGLESGVVMLMVQMAVRTLLENNVTNPEIFLDALNRSIFANIRRMGSDKSLTISLIDYRKGSLKIVGQHEEVLLVRKDGSIERIDTIDLGFMVGLVYNINPYIRQCEAYLSHGDGIVLYTDGVTEAMDSQDNLYGIDRLCNVISSNWKSESSASIKDLILKDIQVFIGETKPLDDVTLLVIKRR